MTRECANDVKENDHTEEEGLYKRRRRGGIGELEGDNPEDSRSMNEVMKNDNTGEESGEWL